MILRAKSSSLKLGQKPLIKFECHSRCLSHENEWEVHQTCQHKLMQIDYHERIGVIDPINDSSTMVACNFLSLSFISAQLWMGCCILYAIMVSTFIQYWLACRFSNELNLLSFRKGVPGKGTIYRLEPIKKIFRIGVSIKGWYVLIIWIHVELVWLPKQVVF